MCIISVAPMPSMISMPVASFHSCARRVRQRLAGRRRTCAATTGRSRAASGAIARYNVGAVNSIVARCVLDRRSSASGPGRSTQQRRRADAHRKQQQAAQPEGERERRRAAEHVVGGRLAASPRGKQSHIASTSRWKCIVPFGLPVVPDVKAMNATSSAAVSTAANRGGLAAARASTPSAAAAGELGDRRQRRARPAREVEFRRPAANRTARALTLRLGDDVDAARARAAAASWPPRSRRPSSPPASTPPSSGCWGRAAARGCPAPRRGRRRSTCAMRLDLRVELGVGAAHAVGARARRGDRPAPRAPRRSSSSTAHVQPLRVAASSGRSKSSSGHWSRGGRLSRAKVSSVRSGTSGLVGRADVGRLRRP